MNETDLAHKIYDRPQITQRIGQREDLGRHAASGAADGLALSPPFAP